MKKQTAKETRSPIRVKPLRDPGESLRDRRDDLLFDVMIPWYGLGVTVLAGTVMEWYCYLLDWGRHPVLYTLVAIAIIAIGYPKFIKARSERRNLTLGIEGERSVGQLLGRLRTDGYYVCHDIVQDGYNIDHVLLGPTGVFAIETKTISKPTDRDAQIVYDGEKVLVDGNVPDRDPVKQAEAAARRVREIIQERTGHKIQVRPVVLYPGWFIKRQCRNEAVWVLNEKALLGWLDHGTLTLPDEDLRRYTAALEDCVRITRD